MLSQYVMKFPIARPTKEQEAEISRLVQDVIKYQSTASERRIDKLVFQIYKLSEDEVKSLICK